MRGAKPGKPYVGRVISHEPAGSAPLFPDEPANRRFGHFYPVTRDVMFWNHTANVNAIAQEAERLLSKMPPHMASESTAGSGK